MKNLKYIFTAICLIGVLSGCYKDDSTSFSIPLADVTIASHEKIPFKIGEMSEYTPTIEWGGTSQEDYDYKWTLNGREVISTELTLKYMFTTLGQQYLTFQMTDKKTGIVYGKDFEITVAAKYLLGWVILSEGTDQSSHLSFVEMDNFESHPDIYSELYPGETLGSKPYGLANTCISKEDQIMVLQDGGEGTVSLNGLSFQKVSYLKHEFIGEQMPADGSKPKFMLFSHRGAEMLIMDNGAMYDRQNAKARTSGAFQDAMFSTIPFSHCAGATKFTNHVFPGGNSYYTPLYDGLNRRWLAYHTTTSTQYAIPTFTIGKNVNFEDGFNYCTGMGEDVELVYGQSHGETGYKMNLTSIVKKGSSYFINDALLTLASGTYRITISDLAQKEFATGYPIDSKTQICMPRGTGTDYNTTANIHVFFNIGKKLYFYHWSTGLTYLFRDFSKETNAPQGDIVALTQRSDTKELGVTFSDGHFFVMDSQLTKLNAIRQSNLDPEKVDNGLVKAHITGIPGKPVATIFKVGKASNYTGAKVAK